MRRDEARRARHITRLPLKLVRQPTDAILAAFDDDFWPLGRHNRKKPVAVNYPKGIEKLPDRGERFRPIHLKSEQSQHWQHRQEQYQRRDWRKNPFPKSGRRRHLQLRSGKKESRCGLQHSIIQKQNAQSDAEQRSAANRPCVL